MDLARGAQTQVRALRDILDVRDQNHRILTLFAAEKMTLNPDISLDVRAGRLRALGFNPVAYFRLRRRLRSIHPDVVVAHGSESLKYAALARPPDIPLIYHRIGVSSRKLRNPIRRLLHRAAVHSADAIVAVSDDTLTELCQLLKEPPKRASVIPNARDSTTFRPRMGEPAGGPPRLLFVGHFVASKRPALFLDVVAAMRGEGIKFEAVMVGDGPLRQSIEGRARALGVDILGARDDVPTILSAAHILVLTSDAYEGLPGVLIEAGLAGLPVVTTDVPGARSAVVDGKTGFVVGLDDKAGLIASVRRLLNDPGLRVEAGTAARAHCMTNFTIDTSAALWRALIDEMIVAR